MDDTFRGINVNDCVFEKNVWCLEETGNVIYKYRQHEITAVYTKGKSHVTTTLCHKRRRKWIGFGYLIEGRVASLWYERINVIFTQQ